MPDTDNKAREKGPKVKVPKPERRAEAVKDESSLYGDEGDIPARRKKKPAKQKAAGASEGGKKSGSGKVKAPRFKSKRKKRADRGKRVYRSLYELMSATGSDSFFKPLKLFGRDIRFWPLILLAIIALLAGGVMLNNSNLSVVQQTVTVVGLPEALEDYRIIVLSDLNGKRFGDNQSLLLRNINNYNYDAIFCVGDMVGSSGNPEPFYEFLEGLKKPDRVYFICGDSDPGPFVTTPRNITGTLSQIILEDWILGAIERGAHYVDAPMQVPVKNARLWVSPATMLNLETVSTVEFWKEQTEQEQDGVMSGVSADYNTLPKTDYRYQQMLKLYNAERDMQTTDIHISLAHEPVADDFIYTSESHKPGTDRYLITPELIVAGHYCNGVWRLPFIGALYVPDVTLPRGGWFPAQSRINGLSSVDETQVYITGGLANNGAVKLMPFRLFNGPQISVLTLTSTLPENMLES